MDIFAHANTLQDNAASGEVLNPEGINRDQNRIINESLSSNTIEEEESSDDIELF